MKYILTTLATAALMACGGGSGDIDVNETSDTDKIQSKPMAISAGVELGDPTLKRVHAEYAPGLYPNVYAPKDIRAAYQMDPLPSTYSNLTAAQAASLGAGQTVYIVVAYSAPNIVPDLYKFAKAYGLPGCKTVAPDTLLKFNESFKMVSGKYVSYTPKRYESVAGKLPPARKTGCDLVIGYTSSVGQTLSSVEPPYDNSWATELTLDVEWVHAIAPYARIVVLESTSSWNTPITDSIRVANKLGPGVVSMSFGSAEWATMYATDGIFQTVGMNYVAAAGDNGVEANWPASSPSVLSVGGTSLRSDGLNPRIETAWRWTGGGYSKFFTIPSWQTYLPKQFNEPKTSTGTRPRAIPDVSFNADWAVSGQVVAYTPGGYPTTWMAYGGTSVGTPQWSGLIAIGNAQRELIGKAPLTKIQTTMYTGRYGTTMRDITAGMNGTCSWCYARVGFDTSTGWGTPDIQTFLERFRSL